MIGIAVPCYKYHIPVLKRFLDSVETQTRKPDYVIVSCSSSTEEDIPKDYTYSFPFQIILTEIRLNAAQNRNLAADQLIKLGCSYISFFDCDDVMHPQRIEGILEGFEKKSGDIILHNYLKLPYELEEDFENYTEFILEKNTISYIKTTEYLRQFSKKIHAAHISVKKDIFQIIRFREGQVYEKGEDTNFVCDTIDYSNENNLVVLYVVNPLSKYFAEGQWY
jgi:hypothetical protein